MNHHRLPISPTTNIQPAGFTLIELLVVLAILVLFPAVLLPALNDSRQKAASIACLDNSKQLALAWMMYANDHNSLLVNLSTYNSKSPTILPTDPVGIPWRCQLTPGGGPNGGTYGGLVICTIPTNLVPNTAAAQQYLIDLSFKQPVTEGTTVIVGPLASYDKNPNTVHCPGDLRYRLPCSVGYQGPSAWDSYSGSMYLNGEERSDGTGNDINKQTAIGRPADRFIWAECAAMRGEDLGSWHMTLPSAAQYAANQIYQNAAFGDSPAAFHGNGAICNFCDGHAELHHWVDGRTLAYANDITPGKDGNFPEGMTTENADAAWAASKYAGNQNP